MSWQKDIKYFLYKVSDLIIKDSLLDKIQYCFHHLNKKRFYGCPDINNPRSFNEKIMWLKRNHRNSLGKKITDKLQVREYVKDKIGSQYLIPLIDTFENEKEIDLDKLPNKFILKPNHGSGWIILCKDKSKMSEAYIKSVYRSWLEKDYYYIAREWQYKGIEPKILCEKYLLRDDNEDLKDYKIFCFHGEPKYIQIDVDRYSNHTRCFYDPEWNKLPFTIIYPKYEGEVSKPSKLKEMVQISKKLSEPLIFSRVDLYCIKDKVYFGEITLHPGSGHKPFCPSNYDLILGRDLSLPKKSNSN